MKWNPRAGLAIAGTVAAMLAGGCGSDDSNIDNTGTSADAIRCFGINECAGHGECANPGQGNSCQGENECAGLGWVTVDSEADCTGAGGEVLTDGEA